MAVPLRATEEPDGDVSKFEAAGSLEFGPRDHILATKGPPLVIWDGRPVE